MDNSEIENLGPIFPIWNNILSILSSKRETRSLITNFDLEALQTICSNINYLAYIRDFMQRLSKMNDEILLQIRFIIKDWISIQTDNLFDENFGDLDILTQIAGECFKEPLIVDNLWNYDYKNDTNISKILNRLLRIFPLKYCKNYFIY